MLFNFMKQEKIKEKEMKEKEEKIFQKYAITDDAKKELGSKIRLAGGFIEGSCCCSSS